MENKRISNTDINWIQVDKDNKHQRELLSSEWIAYMREIYADDVEVNECPDSEIQKWLDARINIQGEKDTNHFELIIVEEQIVGFAMYAVDLGGIKNTLEAGYGYIMEFYVNPQYRRKSIGTQTYMHIKSVFEEHSVDKIYLTPDSKIGIPFWEAMNFKDCGKIDPDNLMPIYINEYGD